MSCVLFRNTLFGLNSYSKYIVEIYILINTPMIGLNNLCRPATVYLVLSMTIVLFLAFQNMTTGRMYCVGLQACPSNSNSVTALFIMKVVYIVFWTWILNVFCGSGNELVAWVLVIIPIVLMFVFIAFLFLGTYDFDLLTPSVSILN